MALLTVNFSDMVEPEHLHCRLEHNLVNKQWLRTCEIAVV